MSEKRVVTCPRCSFRVTDQGDAATPALTADIQAFSRTCPLTGNLTGMMAEKPFNCPELLKAVRHAALMDEMGRTR
jgi:hypothetical protein